MISSGCWRWKISTKGKKKEERTALDQMRVTLLPSLCHSIVVTGTEHLFKKKRFMFYGDSGYSGRLLCSVFDTHWSTRFSFYKNKLYKNIEAENRRKFKNIIRIWRGWDVEDQKNSFNSLENFINVVPNLCILLFVMMICYDVHPLRMFEVSNTSCKVVKWGSKQCLHLKKNLFENMEAGIKIYVKIVLRIYKAHFSEEIKNTEARRNFYHSYEKKACN